MAGDVIVSTLKRFNVDNNGAIMARFLFDVTELESFWCSIVLSCQKSSTKDLSYF